MRSSVSVWSDNRGWINLNVWVKRDGKARRRSFSDIGYSRALLLSGRIARWVRAGRCVVHPLVSEYVGWEARFGFPD